MAVAEFKLTRVADLVKSLEKLGKRVRDKAIKKALREAAKPILRQARANVSVASGTLKASLGVKVKQGKRVKHSGFAVVGPRSTFRNKKLTARLGDGFGGRKPGKYAHLVEGGTDPHQAGRRKHPGSKAQPFLEPAFEQHKHGSVRKIAQVIASELRKHSSR